LGVAMAKAKEENDIIASDVEKEIKSVTTEIINVAIPELPEAAPFEERVIAVDRVSRTQKGGRRMRFRATVVVGDKQGNVGMGIGKANEITGAVAKATNKAKKNIISVPIVRHTIPHEVIGKFDAALVLLKPAAVGTSIIAGGAVRPILELAGIENVVGKCLTRTTNKLNNAYATLKALQSLKDIKEVAPRHYIKKKKASIKDNTLVKVAK
jgi:small subunit ribosomal protein S5